MITRLSFVVVSKNNVALLLVTLVAKHALGGIDLLANGNPDCLESLACRRTFIVSKPSDRGIVTIIFII